MKFFLYFFYLHYRIILFAILASSFNVHAQEVLRDKFQIGFSLGPNFSNFLNSEAPHKVDYFGSAHPFDNLSDKNGVSFYNYSSSLLEDVKIGICAGLNIEYFLKNNLYLKASLNYEQKGINLKYRQFIRTTTSEPSTVSDYSEIFERNISNNYLTMPILLKKTFTGKVRWYIEGGGYWGYLIYSKVNGSSSKIYTFTVIDSPDYNSTRGSRRIFDNVKDKKKEFTSNFDAGISIGTGFSYPITQKILYTTGVLLNLGFVKLDKKYNNEYREGRDYSGRTFLIESGNYYDLNSKAKNISVGLTFGLTYKLGK